MISCFIFFTSLLAAHPYPSENVSAPQQALDIIEEEEEELVDEDEEEDDL